MRPMTRPTALSSWFLGAVPAGMQARPVRDPRIDVFRGLALLIIFVDHVAGNALTMVTPMSLGFSDAAEYFVLLAGFSAALAYGPAIDRKGLVAGGAPVVARIWKIYTAHLALFVFMAVAVAFMAVRFGNPLYYEQVSILPFFQDPANTILQMVTLTFLPNYLDILPLYVVLLALMPAIWMMTRTAPVLALGASAGLYGLAWAFQLALPNFATGGSWFFNPFAWQLLFTVGLVAGHATLNGVELPRSRWLLAAALALIAVGLVTQAPWSVIAGFEAMVLPDAWRLELDKTNLSLWRFAHALSVAYLVARFVAFDAAWLKRGLSRLLEDAGRHSLPLFCLGVILSMIGTFAFFEIGRGPLMQVVVNLTGIAILLGAGRMFQWYRDISAKAPRAAPANASLEEVKTA